MAVEKALARYGDVAHLTGLVGIVHSNADEAFANGDSHHA
jgi:hypothetical protein